MSKKVTNLQDTSWLTKVMTCGWEITGAIHIAGIIRKKKKNLTRIKESSGISRTNLSYEWSFGRHFSWHCFRFDQNGKEDIPAMIDKIQNITHQERIHYVGHSMGTTGFMVMSNERPDYRDKIIMANFLAPVAYVENMRSPIKYLAPFTRIVEVTSHRHFTPIHLFLFVCFVYFRVSLRVHGSVYWLVFTMSLHSLTGQFWDWEIDQFSYSAFIYRPRLQSLLTG